VFDTESRAGGMTTFEQPIPWVEGLTFSVDWFSGNGAYVTPGFIYSYSPFTIYLGYGLANSGRPDDQITFEVGFTI
jgi:hypothetical protein